LFQPVTDVRVGDRPVITFGVNLAALDGSGFNLLLLDRGGADIGQLAFDFVAAAGPELFLSRV
jgi:hypothetical protein